VSPPACWNGVSGESKGLRRYDKENLLWQFTVAIRSVGSENVPHQILIHRIFKEKSPVKANVLKMKKQIGV
jgi:hypothetical protein